jgi:PAS domain S-box-containing protein
LSPQPSPVPDDWSDFRILVENATDAIVVLSVDGRILFGNRSAARLSGYEANRIGHLRLEHVLAPEEIPRVTAIRMARHSGLAAPSQYESVLLASGGERTPVEVTVAPILWRGQAADVIIFRDISERRTAEADLRRRESILKGVASAAERLVKAMQVNEGIDAALEVLGKSIGVHRVYLWQTEFHDGGVSTVIATSGRVSPSRRSRSGVPRDYPAPSVVALDRHPRPW